MRLEWRDLTKRFGNRTVLARLSGALTEGEVLAVCGANGAGKTTFLRMLAGLTRPTQGSVQVSHGAGMRDVRECPYLVGFATAELALYSELTALENLAFFNRVRGLGLTEERLLEQLQQVGLQGREREALASYSSGMRQRVKLAFATLHTPPILLLDEPSNNLDAAGCALVRELIESQRRRGVCVLATNDDREQGYGDRSFRIDE